MKQLTTYNRVAGYLNHIFDLLNRHFFENELSDLTITIQSTPRAYGHFSLREDTWVSALGGPMKSILELGHLIVQSRMSVPPFNMSFVTTMPMFMASRTLAGTGLTITNGLDRSQRATVLSLTTIPSMGGPSPLPVTTY